MAKKKTTSRTAKKSSAARERKAPKKVNAKDGRDGSRHQIEKAEYARALVQVNSK